MKRIFLVYFTALVFLLALNSFSYAVPSYHITDLGTLGGNTSGAAAINDMGQVVGYSTLTSSPYSSQAFLYTQDTGMESLNAPAAGMMGAQACGINNLGQVIGTCSTADLPKVSRSFLWLPETAYGLDAGFHLLGGSSASFAMDINDAGVVVGWYRDSQSYQRGYAYTPVTGMLDLPVQSFSAGGPSAINESGHIVGSQFVNGNNRAFLYASGSPVLDLGTMGGNNSYASDINDTGLLCGYSETIQTWPRMLHAFVYDVNTGDTTDLGLLGSYPTAAVGINDDDTVIGWYYEIRTNYTLAVGSFVYDGAAMHEISSLLDDSGSGWRNIMAVDINNNGQIVGFGTHNGLTRAFLMSPFLAVTIDIKPGDPNNTINPKSNGKVPVAILTTESFDASKVIYESIRLADACPCHWTMEDVDGDGDLDMLCHFNTQDLNLNTSSTFAVMTGDSRGNTPFTASDSVKIINNDKPPKR